MAVAIYGVYGFSDLKFDLIEVFFNIDNFPTFHQELYDHFLEQLHFH